MEYDVFISYSRSDAPVVDEFANALLSKGYKVWIDLTGSSIGSKFKSQIVRAIIASKVVLYFSSTASRGSIWATKEIGIAVKYRKTILPIKLDNSDYNYQVQLDLVDISHESYFANERNPYKFNQLINSIISTIDQFDFLPPPPPQLPTPLDDDDIEEKEIVPSNNEDDQVNTINKQDVDKKKELKDKDDSELPPPPPPLPDDGSTSEAVLGKKMYNYTELPPPPPSLLNQGNTSHQTGFNAMTVPRTFLASLCESVIAQGGQITITADQLLFKAHAINFGDTSLKAWDIRSICGYEKTFPTFLTIYFNDRKAYKFSLYNRNEVMRILEERRRYFYENNGFPVPPLKFT